jgi:hypothetical protein
MDQEVVPVEPGPSLPGSLRNAGFLISLKDSSFRRVFFISKSLDQEVVPVEPGPSRQKKTLQFEGSFFILISLDQEVVPAKPESSRHIKEACNVAASLYFQTSLNTDFISAIKLMPFHLPFFH